MRLPLPFVAAFIGAVLLFSCGKDKSPSQPPVDNGGKRKISFSLRGDFGITETPLGNGRQVNPGLFARELEDSIVYALAAYKSYHDRYYYAQGVFHRTDSMTLELPDTGKFTIVALAIKKGTGNGLYYDLKNGIPYYWCLLGDNVLDKVQYGSSLRLVDTFSFKPVFGDNRQPVQQLIPELDSYRGTTIVDAATAPGILSINMRRLSFGVKYDVSNFTSGRLIAEYFEPEYYGYNAMAANYITPETAGSTLKIYTCDDFKASDFMISPANLKVKLSWEKSPGNIIPIGEKAISFKRNVLTTINVTIPDAGRVTLPITLSDTAWTGSETVTF